MSEFINKNKLFKVGFDHEPEKLNRFLVRFPSEIGINEWWIESFKKPPYYLINGKWGSTVAFKLRTIFSSNGEDWHPYMKDSEIIANFKKYNETNYDYILFEELDATGFTISKTKYTNPKFTKIDFDEYNYANDGIKGYTLEMSFDDVIEA